MKNTHKSDELLKWALHFLALFAGFQQCLAGTNSAALSTPAAASAWSASASLGLREAYDSNVYMQRVTPLANQDSFVTVLTPSIAAQWKPAAGFSVSANYSPEMAFYHSESSENYIAHRGALNFGGKLNDITWELLNGITWIDGNPRSPTFFGPGGAPALGGVPLRDRRAAAIYREGFKLQYPVGNWFLRPVASAYVHDFMTEHHANPAGGVYQNYADRNDVNGGLDIGYKILPNLYAVAGYRHGSQEQDRVRSNPIEYSNTYNRGLFGIEGRPFDWLKLSVALGPDFRSFGPAVPTGFDRERTKVYLDATATVTPTKSDSIALTAKRFEQPGYGGASVYEDSTYEIAWRHKFGAKFSVGIALRALNWNFELPVKRNEWWYNVNASATYAFTEKISAELNYGYDNVESLIVNTAGREAERHVLSIGARYSF